MNLNFSSSCLCLSSAEITSMRHHPWLSHYHLCLLLFHMPWVPCTNSTIVVYQSLHMFFKHTNPRIETATSIVQLNKLRHRDIVKFLVIQWLSLIWVPFPDLILHVSVSLRERVFQGRQPIYPVSIWPVSGNLYWFGAVVSWGTNTLFWAEHNDASVHLLLQ